MFKQRFYNKNDKIQSVTLKSLSHKYRNTTSFTENRPVLTYESTEVKWILTPEWTCAVELAKRSNANYGFGNVNHSGIFTLLTWTLPTKDHHIDCVEGMSVCPMCQSGIVTMGANNDKMPMIILYSLQDILKPPKHYVRSLRV